MLRRLFINLSHSEGARYAVTHFGPARGMARRFVAGESLAEAVAVVKDLNARGIKAILNEVGESVTTRAEAERVVEDFQLLLQRIAEEQLDSTVSVKPSHIGLAFGRDFCYKNLAGIMQQARQLNNVVEIDMEGSLDIDDTLAIYHRLLDDFGDGLRLAIQSYLYRTPNDLQAIIQRGGGVRLVKGAYDEPPTIAYQGADEINQATIQLMAEFLKPEAQERGAYLALGSHDPELIDWLIREAEACGIEKDRFEFQMLLGVRRDEQQRLADLGYRVRVYVPYGSHWYPYFMRRLAERPANLFFIVRAFLGK